MARMSTTSGSVALCLNDIVNGCCARMVRRVARKYTHTQAVARQVHLAGVAGTDKTANAIADVHEALHIQEAGGMRG